ncbi:MAG: sulfatase [Verrucomicrobia bacterium]|nr:sulfatase [Verrucomicrobiota bacterium]
MNGKLHSVFRITLLTLGLLVGTVSLNAADKLNVLFIAVDDLRPELGCYGTPVVKSPNIDRLAARGLLFNRAYCQQALCSPSRTSLLTGRRPDTTKVYNLQKHFRTELPDVVTLPQFFKQHGYHSLGMGKIYHGALDDAPSWSVPHWKSGGPNYGPEGEKMYRDRVAETKKQGKTARWREDGIKGPPWESPSVPDNALADGKTADHAVAMLREYRAKPFFLAVGFVRPHLPFVAPKKYWDLYSENDFTLAPNPFPPKDVPEYAMYHWGELRGYIGMPAEGPLTDEQARKMIHGYYACVSFVDAQVGRLLDELDRLKLREKTIVILWGDHGWQLGEHGLWCKHTNFEEATRSPMIISVPGQRNAGSRTEALVEFVDIYPSLAELCGLSLPEGLEGTSFKPLLDDPQRPWKKAAFSQYPRPIPDQGRGMGHTLRTERYRFTEWTVPGKDFREYELYDYQTDPQGNRNLANQPDYAAKVKELAELMRGGWRAALPPTK